MAGCPIPPAEAKQGERRVLCGLPRGAAEAPCAHLPSSHSQWRLGGCRGPRDSGPFPLGPWASHRTVPFPGFLGSDGAAGAQHQRGGPGPWWVGRGGGTGGAGGRGAGAGCGGRRAGGLRKPGAGVWAKLFTGPSRGSPCPDPVRATPPRGLSFSLCRVWDGTGLTDGPPAPTCLSTEVTPFLMTPQASQAAVLRTQPCPSSESGLAGGQAGYGPGEWVRTRGRLP